MTRFSPRLAFYPRAFWNGYWTNRNIKEGWLEDEAWLRFCRGIVRMFEEMGVRFEFEGIEHLTSFEGPCVIAMNHLSLLEGFVIPACVHPLKPINATAAAKLPKLPVMGPMIEARRPIFLKRQSAREDLLTVYRHGEALIQNGWSVLIAPQGTRRKVFRPHEFNSLAVKLAKRTGVPLITLALKTDCWPKGGPFSHFGKIYPERQARFVFSKPVTVEKNDLTARAYSIRFIMKHLREWNLPVDDTRVPWWLK